MPPVRIPRAPPAYRCTFDYFWTGLTDWFAEQSLPARARHDLPDSQGPAEPGVGSVLAKTVLGAVLLLLLIAFVVAQLAPVLVQGMAWAGTGAVADAAMWLAGLSSLAFLLWVPLSAGRRVWRFTHRMCRRGYEIRHGLRDRVSAVATRR